MQSIGVIGLGRMGLGVVERLLDNGIAVYGHDPLPDARQHAAAKGAQVLATPQELVAAVPAQPRIICLMVPAGDAVDTTLFGENGVAAHLDTGDIVIDAGNSFYRDSVQRAAKLVEAGIHYLDCGSSGGPHGAREGMCLMVGGPEAAYQQVKPIFTALACTDGLQYVGPSGSGHYVKMVHNAIEYGMLQAIGEGFELLEAGPYDLDLEQVARLWTKGSVIRGWLMELMADALSQHPQLEHIRGEVGGGSTGSWAIEEAWKAGVPFSNIALAVSLRHRSRQNDSFAGKVVAALRHEFGGHEVVPAAESGDSPATNDR